MIVNNPSSQLNQSSPLISVIMSVYKEPLEWIHESIDSILNQTFTNFEFIIINDNPLSEETRLFLIESAKKDNRITIITNKQNLGLTKSLNIGIRCSRGKYIARMDADDISLPKRFEKQIALMESKSDIIVCGTNVKLIGRFNPFYVKKIFTDDKDIRGQMFLNSGFAHPSVMIRKSVLNKSGIMYDENFRSAQDYKLWYDLRHYGRYVNLKERLLKYRLSKQQITSNSSLNQQKNREIISNLFRKDYNPEDKIEQAYLSRSKAYENPTTLMLWKISISPYTHIKLKERISLIIKGFIKIIM